MEGGFSVLLDPRGKLCSVVEDAGGLFEPSDVGGLFATRIDSASSSKFFQFLAEVNNKQAAYGWEINLLMGEVAHAVFLTGVRHQGSVLVVGAFSRDAMSQYLEELVAMNSEHTNEFRTLLRELSTEKKQKIRALDELTEMNNQLVNLQRELTLKNNMLDQQSKVLEKLNEDKNRFLGMAAHDLRNPLGVILNLSGILLSEKGQVDAAEVADFAGIIHESSRFMLRLLEDLLDISVIESGKLNLQASTQNIVDVLFRNVEMNRLLAREKEISLTFEKPCETFLVEVDRGKVEQVVNNLISNAIKFSDRGSSVDVLLHIDAKDCVVSVRDHGQGIPPEELEGIFSEFVTTSTKSTEGEKSTGLGLMIAQKIVKAHDGRIWVESRLGHGTTFSFALPHGIDLSEEDLARMEKPAVPEEQEIAEEEGMRIELGSLEPLTVVSTEEAFGKSLEAAFPGTFQIHWIQQAKDFLLLSSDDDDERAVCIDCANLDMQLPVLLAFSKRKSLKARIHLCNFAPGMLGADQLEDFGVRQVVAAGESLEQLALSPGDA